MTFVHENRLKKMLILFAAFASFALNQGTATPAHATAIGSSKRLGVGVTLGSPSGFTLRYFTSSRDLLQLDLGVGFFGGSGASVNLDYKRELAATRTSSFKLPFYLGIGGKMMFWFEDGPHGYWGGKDDHVGRVGVGVRMPIGIAFQFSRLPLEISLEVAPGLGFFPPVGVFVDGALAFRYYF